MTLKTLAVAVVLAAGVSACGTADENAADTPNGPSTNTAQAGGGGKHSQHNGGDATTDTTSDAGADEMDGMVTLAETTEDDLEVQLHAMPPERFFVSEGDDMREQAPTDGDDAHLMVTLADAESGVRLPDATVTARVMDSSEQTSFEGPLYPMVGRGMGMHYGENVVIGEAGDYTVELTIGSPRVGRHRAVADAWSTTRKITQQVSFDGKTLAKR